MADKKLNILEGGKKWLYSLMGKVPPSAANKEETEAQVDSEPQEIKEDSVANDINAFKSFVKKGIDGTKVILSPFAKKGALIATDSTKTVTSSVDRKFIKTLVRSFLIIFFTVILVFVAIYLFQNLKKENGISQNNIIPPTPAPFEAYKPSVYAKDPEILKLEEEINILERELSSTNIKEDGINPPSLDWNISF